MEKIVEIKKINCKIQVGGIRNIKTIENYLSSGIDRIVLGTIAIEDPDFVIETCKRFPNKLLLVWIQKRFCGHSRMGKKTKVHFKEVIDFYELSKVSALVFTDIDKDGLMEGANYKQLNKLLSLTKLKIIASEESLLLMI